MDEKWDILIVLDACRYDFFSCMYKKFLLGNLEEVKSLGSSTLEWLVKSFRKYYKDVVYFSANPYINSFADVKIGLWKWSARKHFYKIIDVWKFGWDNFFGTVPPWEVNKVVLNSKDRYAGKRLIIHFLQPHEPYLYPSINPIGFNHPDPLKGTFLENSGTSGMIKFLRLFLDNLTKYPFAKITYHLGLNTESIWRLREKFRLPPASPMDAVRRKYGVRILRLAYAFNLRIVLEYVSLLVNHLEGEIIITSDHGEFLGERGYFSHNWGIKNRIVRHVPWFIVHGSKISNLSPMVKQIERISREYQLINKIRMIKTRRRKLLTNPSFS